ncbi:MAG: ribonuclease Z [Nanoarchaeota archaeon]
MDKVKIIFLGTGSSIPTKKRSHPAVLFQFKDENILIDCGEGTQRQFRIGNLNPCKLTRILITHWHGDHVLGLPGLLQTLALNGYNKTLEIYGPETSKKMIDLYQKLFVHEEKISISCHDISGKFFETEDFYIEAEKMAHNVPSLAYSLILKGRTRLDKDKLNKLNLQKSPLIGELKKGKTIKLNGKKICGKNLIFKEPERKVTLILDTVYNANCKKIAKNSDLLICESSYSADEKELAKERFHLTSEQAGKIAKESKSKKLILTHLSQRYDANSQIILEQAKKIFSNTILANDFDEIEI